MPIPEDEGRKVRLRTRRLSLFMDEKGLSASEIEQRGGEPTKRTINRWLLQGRRAVDGLVLTQLRYVATVAEVLDVDLDDLVEGASGAEPEEEPVLYVAASLGPLVYPDLLDHVGVPLPSPLPLDISDLLRPAIGHRHARYRFARWSLCEDILKSGAGLSQDTARLALSWARQHDLGPDGAPELYNACARALGQADVAWVTGLVWLRRAVQHGLLLEAAWVGERLLDPEILPETRAIEERVESVSLLVRALRLTGAAARALDVLTDLTIDLRLRESPLLLGRVYTDMARVRNDLGQNEKGLELADRAIALLEEAGEVARPSSFEALLERAYLLQQGGRSDEADLVFESLDERVGAAPRSEIGRLYRVQGLAALDRGDIARALESFLEAVDLARSDGDLRGVGLGQLNVAIAWALLGDPEQARSAFDQSAAYVAGGEAGPFAVALVHRDLGQFHLEQGDATSSRRHLDIALAQFGEAGDYPTDRAWCHSFLAEAAALDGNVAECRRLVRLAIREAGTAGDPILTAMAYAVLALGSAAEPETADAWATSAEAVLREVPKRLHVVQRIAVQRRCHMARLGGPRKREVKRSLLRLRRQCVELGLGAEISKIDALFRRRR